MAVIMIQSNWSGSRSMLPSISPLRTVHESFPSYGSSLSLALYRTRLRNGFFLAVNLSVAIWVQQDEIVHPVASSIDPWNNMVDMPPRDFCDLVAAYRADTFLLHPQRELFPSTS